MASDSISQPCPACKSGKVLRPSFTDSGKDIEKSCSVCRGLGWIYLSKEDLSARILELEAQLAALDWTPITAENLPKAGDETINTSGYVMLKGRVTDLWNVNTWIDNRWTHFRPINPPAKERP